MLRTSWIEPIPEIGGLDHLGVQAPCVNLYTQILPGITNVTDRAWYYAFYPWVLQEHEQRGLARNREALIATVRRADCLATLVGIHHATTTDQHERRHGLKMVGRERLGPAYERAVRTGTPIPLADFTVHSREKIGYFKNPYGGLGQYYLGTLRELEILAGTTSQILKYVRGRGDDLADVFAAGVEGDRFFACLSRESIGLEDLEGLLSFCPCQVPRNPLLQASLIDLMFDRRKRYGSLGEQRRRALALLLHLAGELELLTDGGDGAPLDEDLFRSAVYSRALTDAQNWDVPSSLDPACQQWERYQRNELFSLALQGIFWTGLVWLRDQTVPVPSSEVLRAEFPRALADLALPGKADWSFAQAVGQAREHLPGLEDWEHPAHELQLARPLLEASKHRGSLEGQARILGHAVQVLIALAARHVASDDPYRLFLHEPGYFEDYPLNLRAFQTQARHGWQGRPLRELLGWWVTHWGIDAHLRVALRKLRGQVQDTFRVRPTDSGLQVQERIPEPVQTTPRFTQAVQILADLDLLELNRAGSRARLTSAGSAVLEEVLHG